MQDKNNTTEIITIVSSIAAFLAGVGIIDVDLGKVVQVSGQMKEIAEGIDTSSVKFIVEGVYRIVCLLLGGGIIMTYLKYKAAKNQPVIIQKVENPIQETVQVEEIPEEVIEEMVMDEDIPEDVIEDPGIEDDEEYKLVKV